MSRSEVTLEELSSLLPDLEELELLRLTLVGSAVPDPGKEWDSSSAYATIDKRIVTLSQVERAVNESEEALHHYVSSLYRALRPVVHSFWSGDGAGTVRCLIELGDFLEQSGLYRKARHSYEVAFNRSLPLLDKGPQILALRRIARVALSLGDLQDALSHYQRSAELAHDSGDLHGEIVALTGLGNALVWQGRWTEAERRYREALALVDQANGGERLLLERAQLYNNLGNVATRQMQLEEADRWFSKALEIWTALPSSFDLAVCRHNQALLRDAQDRHEEALAFYRQALDLSIPSGTWAGIAIDFAESLLRDGHVLQAEEWGRAAEERAIAARSPYYLGRMYQGRGNIARAQGDDGGFTFFEKALQIAREKEYPLLEAETLVDYALLRNQTGGVEEAQAYLERARDIFAELGAVHELVRAEQALREICAEGELAIPAD